ncbi:MAG: leucine-rich repeat domain-containing protein [Ruminococcus sp.]|nr:leucine-rich repeat domain-containing protein [Ruminococcus sp.]
MKKQFISGLMALSIVFGSAAVLPDGFAPQSAITARAGMIYGDFHYNVLHDVGTLYINEYTGSDSNIAIPSEIKGNSVTHINDKAFEYCTSLENVTIPDSVTYIGHRVFGGCTSLKSVTIPDSVTSIGVSMFSDCTGLTSIEIPDHITLIDDDAFAYCTNLTTVKIPNSVTKIHVRAFVGCTDLKSITIPSSVTYIGSETFDECPNVTIECFSGSAAEAYAKENGIKYRLLDADTTSIANATVTGIKNKTYTGKKIKPAPVVKIDGVKLQKGTDYTVSYKNNKKIGKATVTIKGKGAYTGTITKSFKINPRKTAAKKVTSPKTKQLKVTYKKVSGVTGYQVTYSTSEKFTKKTTKTVTVKGVSKTSKTIKKLTKGKTYYVKVRTYKTVGKVKYYSAYSKSLKVKVK